MANEYQIGTISAEVLEDGSSAAHVSVLSAEVLGNGSSDARVQAVSAEALHIGAPVVRASVCAIEALHGASLPSSQTLLSAVGVEVLRSVADAIATRGRRMSLM